MPIADIATSSERARCIGTIEAWADDRMAVPDTSILIVLRDPEVDRFYVRLRGEEKDVITVWLTIRQRTLHHEAQFMPAPETDPAGTYAYLLRRNADLHQMRFCLGAEDAVYLVGELPVSDVTGAELDRIVGSSIAYTDAYFPTAMSIGYAGKYRRRTR